MNSTCFMTGHESTGQPLATGPKTVSQVSTLAGEFVVHGFGPAGPKFNCALRAWDDWGRSRSILVIVM